MNTFFFFFFIFFIRKERKRTWNILLHPVLRGPNYRNVSPVHKPDRLVTVSRIVAVPFVRRSLTGSNGNGQTAVRRRIAPRRTRAVAVETVRRLGRRVVRLRGVGRYD